MAHHTRLTKKSKAVTFRIPADIDLSRIPIERRDHAAFVLNLIGSKTVAWQSDADGWVRLKAEYLRGILSRKVWPALRSEMIDLGILECDHCYVIGEKSYGYRVPNPFQPTRPVPCTNPDFLRRLAKFRRQREKTLQPVDKWLRSHFRTLDFDEVGAREVIETLTPRADSTLGTESYRAVTRESAARFADGDHFYVKCDHNRRHTPLTNLPKSLRRCLTVCGETLVGIDLANSQPLFAGLAAVTEYSKSKGGRETNGTGREASYLTTMAGLPEPETVNRVAATIPGDLRDYLDVCQAGEFYESLMPPNDDRDVFKPTVFRDIFYGRDGRPSDLRTRFAARWPSMAGWLQRLKSTDYRRASHAMQQAESRLFIDGACDRIRRERPRTPVATIHDSLVTTPANIEYVRGVLNDEFERLGVRPTLTEETLG